MKFNVLLIIALALFIQGCANNRVPSALSANLLMTLPPNLSRVEFDRLITKNNTLDEIQGFIVPFKGNFQLTKNLQEKLFLDTLYLNHSYLRAEDKKFVKNQLELLEKLPLYSVNMSDLHRRILGVGQITWDPSSKDEKLRDSVNLVFNNLINHLRLKIVSKYDYAEYKSIQRKRELIEARDLDVLKMKASSNFRKKSRIRFEGDFGVLIGPDKGGLNFGIDSKYKIYNEDYVGFKLGRMYALNDYSSNQVINYFALTYEHITKSNLATNRYNNFHYWGFGLGLFQSDISNSTRINNLNRNYTYSQRDYFPGIFIRNGTQIGPMRLGYAIYGLPKVEFATPAGAVLGISNFFLNVNIGVNINGSRWQ